MSFVGGVYGPISPSGAGGVGPFNEFYVKSSDKRQTKTHFKASILCYLNSGGEKNGLVDLFADRTVYSEQVSQRLVKSINQVYKEFISIADEHPDKREEFKANVKAWGDKLAAFCPNSSH